MRGGKFLIGGLGGRGREPLNVAVGVKAVGANNTMTVRSLTGAGGLISLLNGTGIELSRSGD
jgi:hypothetical protein